MTENGVTLRTYFRGFHPVIKKTDNLKLFYLNNYNYISKDDAHESVYSKGNIEIWTWC